MFELIDVTKVYKGQKRAVDRGARPAAPPGHAGAAAPGRGGHVWETVVAPETVPAVQARHTVSRMVRTDGGVRLRLLSPTRPDPDARPATPDLEDAYLGVVAP